MPQNFGNLEESDFKIPMVSVVQDKSKKGVPGNFRFSSGEEVKELKNISLVIPKKDRRLFDKLGEDKVLCASDNWYKPSVRIDDPVSDNCLICPLQMWGDNMSYDETQTKQKWANRLAVALDNKPLCRANFSLLMLNSNKVPFILNASGKNFTIVKDELNTRLKTSKDMLMFDISLKEVDDKKGSFWALVFSNFRVMDKDTEAVVAEIEAGMSGMFMSGMKQIESAPAAQIEHKKNSNAAFAEEISEVPHPADQEIVVNDTSKLPF